jgi:ribonuclease BN (tRNA processing enzyme)
MTTLIFPATVGQYRNVKLTVVGCSPAWPNPGSAHSGYLVTSGDRRLLLDCGPGVLARLREAEPWPTIDAIVLTHLHLDHCGDLVPWLWGHVLGPAKEIPGPQLFVPPAGLARISAFAPLGRFLEVFGVHEYADGDTFEAAGHLVTPRAVIHYGEPAFALRVEHDGRILAYSGDSGPTQSLVEVAWDADAFLCEATLLEREPEPHGHLSAAEARVIAAEAGAKRLLITHRGSEHPVDESVYDGFELEL